MKLSLLGSILLLALAARAQAPAKISAEGGEPDDRASARVLYWDEARNTAVGQFAIDYGRPVWKKDYEDSAKFDSMTKGKVWRLGSNFWTLLDTCLPISIGGKTVRPGYYYLGLHRSADGSTWSLAFIDPGRVRQAHLDAFDIRKAQVAFEAPMTVDKAQGMVQKLTITLTYPKQNLTDVTLHVAWGNLALTTPIKVTLAGR